MSSFINAKHLKVMLGQESPVEKAWNNYYGLEVFTRGMILLPYAIELYYPYTQTTEWELAAIRMIIHCSDLPDGPVATFELQDFADRFHLSLRQIRRKIKVMVEKGLLLITSIYDDRGKKTRSKSYDCNPFLDKIFACICTDDAWQSQHSELLASIGIDEESDDIDALSMLDTEPIVIVPAPTASERAQMSSAAITIPGTSMSPLSNISSRTSMSPLSDIISRTSMSPLSDIISRTSMSPQNIAPSAENPTSYVHAHTHTRALGSNSNSNSHSINNNINPTFRRVIDRKTEIR